MAFFIQNVNSGKYLDVKDSDENPGAQVILFEYTGGENQQWEFKKGRIHSKLNGLVMDLKDDAETGPVVMWPDNGGDNQKWHLDNDFTIRSALGTVMGVPNNTTADGTPLKGYTKTGADSQKFRIVPVDD